MREPVRHGPGLAAAAQQLVVSRTEHAPRPLIVEIASLIDHTE
jgi:hypothetical protein